MLKCYYTISCLFVFLLTSCGSGSINTIREHSHDNQISTISSKESIDDNFQAFIEKFSTDSAFQLNRIKFPLKTKWYDIDNDRDSLIYKERSEFEMMNFRKNNSKGRYDQWEQKIIADKNKASVTIEYRGIDNGIMVDYLFEKVNGNWMLIEIVDNST